MIFDSVHSVKGIDDAKGAKATEQSTLVEPERSKAKADATQTQGKLRAKQRTTQDNTPTHTPTQKTKNEQIVKLNIPHEKHHRHSIAFRLILSLT